MRRINPTDLVAQSIDDLEKIEETVDTTGVTGWDITAALIILALAWPIGAIVARIVRRGVRRVPGFQNYLPDVVGKSVRFLILFIAIAIGLNLVGVDVGWFTIIVALVGVVVFLLAQPLVENFAAGLLLQTRPAFNVGDVIETHGTRGEVLEINARSTVRPRIGKGSTSRTRTSSQTPSSCFQRLIGAARRSNWKSNTVPTSRNPRGYSSTRPRPSKGFTPIRLRTSVPAVSAQARTSCLSGGGTTRI